MKVVNVAGVLSTPEIGVEYHDSTAMYHEAYSSTEILEEPVREVIKNLVEEGVGEEHLIVFWKVARHDSEEGDASRVE